MVWGGPVWGVVIPLVVCGGWWVVCRKVPQVVRFFVGFCLIANGAYIGLGWIKRSGDAADMLRLGTPVGVMIAFGVPCVIGGLLFWHRTAGLSPAARRNAPRRD